MLHRTGLLTEAQVRGSIAMPLSTTQFYEAYDHEIERHLHTLTTLQVRLCSKHWLVNLDFTASSDYHDS